MARLLEMWQHDAGKVQATLRQVSVFEINNPAGPARIDVYAKMKRRMPAEHEPDSVNFLC